MVAELIPVEEGPKVPRYRIVPNLWRTFVPTRRNIFTRRRRKSKSPLVRDLLLGKTVLIEEYLTSDERSTLNTVLYRTATSNQKQLHSHYFSDIDKDVYKGLLIWMEDQYKFTKEHINLVLKGRGFSDSTIPAWWSRKRPQLSGANAEQAWEQNHMLVLYLAMNILESEDKWD